jgi:ankyrin repeat protein
MTALMVACAQKNEEAAALLMEATKNAGALDVQGGSSDSSALYIATIDGLESTVSKLLSLGADVALKDRNKYSQKTPLHKAAEHGHLNIVQAFTSTGAEVNCKDSCSYTPLHMAAMNGHVNVVQALLSAGAEVNCKDSSGQTPLAMAKRYDQHEVQALLEEHGGQ